MARSLVVLCNLIALAHAYTTFQTNCTTPSTAVNFVSSNNTRGTIDILWSCLFTIVACTWTVQHLNVPEQREDRDKGWLGDIKWALKRTWTSAKWMLTTAVAPEVLISKNLGDLLDIKADLPRLRELAKEDGVPWSRTRSLFANMGGFVIRGNVPERLGNSENIRKGPGASGAPKAISDSQERGEKLQSHSASVITSGQQSHDLETFPASHTSTYSNPYHILASDIVALREAGFLTRLPYITTAELNDKNKSDSLVRFIAIVQILWIVIQIIVRASRHLAISQLEIAVVAFAICAIIIYGLNWEKPKDVHVPYVILQYNGDIPNEVLETADNWRTNASSTLASLLKILKSLISLPIPIPIPESSNRPGSQIPNHSPSSQRSRSESGQLAGLFFGGIVFGAVHVAAWDFAFPSTVERKLWWAASIICTSTPIFLLTSTTMKRFLESFYEGGHWTIWIRVFLFPVLYIAARLFLLVEIFRTLLFLPPSAYVATWAANVPHIA